MVLTQSWYVHFVIHWVMSLWMHPLFYFLNKLEILFFNSLGDLFWRYPKNYQNAIIFLALQHFKISLLFFDNFITAYKCILVTFSPIFLSYPSHSCWISSKPVLRFSHPVCFVLLFCGLLSLELHGCGVNSWIMGFMLLSVLIPPKEMTLSISNDETAKSPCGIWWAPLCK